MARKTDEEILRSVRPRIAINLSGAPGGLDAILRQNNLRLLPYFDQESQQAIEVLNKRAKERQPERLLPRLDTWFQVALPRGAKAEELVQEIRKANGVETAYLVRPSPPPVSPGDDIWNASQAYLDAAPSGIDARYAWQHGLSGEGAAYVDLEQGWNFHHEDLRDAGIALLSGLNYRFVWHGTRVLGAISMVDNNKGGVGIAPSAVARAMSLWKTASVYDVPWAILHAAAAMAPGDILLLEAQEIDPVRERDGWPVEIADLTYNAIVHAVAAGVAVVEAAGNGGHKLDSYEDLSGRTIFRRGSPDFRDSGAIMVAAGGSAAPHKRVTSSSYGSRIDCYAWGQKIVTSDDPGYTNHFAQTSGASAIVAGACLIVQGAAKGAAGAPLSPEALRNVLLDGATPSKTPATDKIGVMPNLRAIIETHRLVSESTRAAGAGR
ncbi:MAG: S8 family serine peptidase [Bryobacteraceae bacterium]|nr:S8 family serine peptidase [Bryobacteraceae bacterium]